MPRATAPKAAKRTLDAVALVSHLVAELRGIECSDEDIFEHLKGILRWSASEAARVIETALSERQLSRKASDDSGYTVGLAYDPEKNPSELKAAKRAAARARRVPSIDRGQQRREVILAELSPRVPRTTESLWNALEPTFGYRRKLERDLADLKKAGLIERSSEGWLDSREQNIQLEQATVTALGLMLSLYEDIVPFDLQEKLRGHLEKAKRRLSTLPSNDPGVRWLRALRITPPRHDLDKPLVDTNVKSVIEEAILRNQKVHLRWRAFDKYEGTAEYADDYSISHLLLEVPAYQRIDVWSNGRGRRIALNEIIESRLLDQRADYPLDYEPIPFPPEMRMEFGDCNEHQGKSLITLDMSRSTYDRLMTKRIGSLFSEPIIKEDGWLTVTFRAKLDMPVYRYLVGLDGVSFVGPRLLRASAMGSLHASRKRYLATTQEADQCHALEKRHVEQCPDEVDDHQERSE